jgi:hypothetical protein
MLVINTPFFVATTHLDQFLKWVSNVYVPNMMKTDHFSASRFYQVLSHQEQDSTGYSLQFEFAEPALYRHWEDRHHAALQEELKLLFNEHVLSFSTLLKQV